ncbi:MAG: antA/AntB antirepressor family protein [Bacteroidota bacterium]
MELIKIYQGNVISARELYEFFQLRERFSRWFDRMMQYGFTEGEDYTPYQKVHPQNQQVISDYHLSLACAKEISMLQRSELGRAARQYFIRCEETLQAIKQNKRLEYWEKLESVKGELKNYFLEKGHTTENFLQVDFEGRKVLFNGTPLPDEVLPNILLTARSFAIEMSNEFLKQSGTKSLSEIEKVHQANHGDVRNLMQENTGKLPENYDTEKHIGKEEDQNKSKDDK